MQFCFADLEQQIVNSPSRQGGGRTYQEKIVNANYVINPKLEMNTIRERPFNLKGGGGGGGGGGGYVFFLKKYSDSQCCWKKYSDFGGGKKNNLIQSFCHNVKFWKKKYSNSCVVRKKISERNKKP